MGEQMTHVPVREMEPDVAEPVEVHSLEDESAAAEAKIEGIKERVSGEEESETK